MRPRTVAVVCAALTICTCLRPIAGQSPALPRLQTDGRFTEFPLPNPDSGPTTIAIARDGTLWFTEGNGNRIGRMSPDGATLWQLGSLGSPWTVRSRTVDGTVLDRTRLGVGPVSRFTRDGSKLVTLVGASSVSTTLKIVDAR